MKLSPINMKAIILLFTLFLSVSLMAQEGTVIVNQDKEIDDLLALKKDIETTSSDRYKIQIFSGTNRSEAESVRSKFNGSYGDWPSSIEWNTPNFKIWVGNFRSKLEAERALLKIKRKFSNAFIFKPKD